MYRPAAVSDAASIAEVHRVSRADYYGVAPVPDDDRAAMWTALLAQPDRLTYLAEASGTAIGFMSAHRATAPIDELEMTALYVLPSHHGHGVGSGLHDLFQGHLGHLGPGSSGVLEVWAGNRRAIGFYGRRGWVATSTTRPGPLETDFVTYRLPAGKPR